LTKKEKKKAERAEWLRKGLIKVRKKTQADLRKSVDSKEFHAALAVALIDETYARIGNKKSEDDGHFGITGWQKKHLTFSGGTATLKYVGKSGVSHEKTVRTKSLVTALKKLADKAEKGSDPLFQYEYAEGTSRLTSSDVNDYLEEFDVTAKDLRGYHANAEMRIVLEGIRADNGALPEDKKKREEALEKEFKQALKTVAKCLGHEEATLRTHYLVHNFEKTFFEEGKPLNKFSSRSRQRMALRVARRVFYQQ